MDLFTYSRIFPWVVSLKEYILNSCSSVFFQSVFARVELFVLNKEKLLAIGSMAKFENLIAFAEV